jgi:DNA polymerase-3 subunit delta
MAEINRKELKKQISNKSFSNLYLIFGDEKMYVKADTDLLVTKLMGKEPPEFNYHSFTDDYTMDDVAIAVQVMPFVSEYNCVKISDLDVNNLKKAEFDQFMAILENTPDTTVVIITLPTLMIDSKKKGANFTKLLNFVKKKGVACDIAQETDISLARQIVKWADSRGVKIEQADAYKLQEYVGFDLNSIRNELDKLCNYIGDGELITEEHIEMLTTKRLEANIFHLSDAIVQCNSTKAYEIIDVLMYQKIEPIQIVNQLGIAYTDFYRVRVANECGVPLSEIAKEFGYGKREFVLKKIQKQIINISTNNLRNSLRDITDVSAKFRSESINPRIMLETLVAKLVMYAGKEA